MEGKLKNSQKFPQEWEAFQRCGSSRFLSVEEQFDAHLEVLADGNYHVWPLDKIVNQLRQGHNIPDKTIAITIDDAYLSVFTEARPRLNAHGLSLIHI